MSTASSQPAAAPAPGLRGEDFAPVTSARGERGPTRPSLSYWADAWIRLKKNRQAVVSLAMVVLLALFCTVGPLLWRVDPNAQDLTRYLEAPSLGRTAVVLAEPVPMEPMTLPDVPARAQGVDGASLPAPAKLELLEDPTTLSVRLRWAPVPGAAGYQVYRSTAKPEGDYLGLPLGRIDAGNVVSFEDTFNLEAQTYYYSVVAANGADSPRAATVTVRPARAIGLAAAQALQPGIAEGATYRYPLRPLGTDNLGRDLLVRLMRGGQVSLSIGFFAPLLYLLIGVLIGGISGYLGGAADQWIMRFVDFVLALPSLLVLILISVALGAGPGRSIAALIIGLVALSWSGAARLTRGQVLQLRESEFVQAARLLGAKPGYLLLRHLLPNTLGVILVSFTFAIPGAIFTEAFLSFIGMGVKPPMPSWGNMAENGYNTFLTSPHLFIFPALFISAAVLAFNLLGDGLRDALDPKLRSRE
ncbi:MAG TPA: ABC transporter permease [Anaeromyxobacter sp.]|nr:ABC transporter permease [Anaeromyxobacter sp.]